MARFRSHWLPALRVLAVTLFALSLLVQPVMAAAGEMHELAHDPSGAHTHALHAGTVAGGVDDLDQDVAEVLHLMLHFAHCCVATAALLPSPNTIIGVPLAVHLPSAKSAFPTQTRLVSPFKPPIFV